MKDLRAVLVVISRLRRAGARRDRTPDVLSVLAFAVATAALLLTLGGLHAFAERSAADPASEYGGLYVALAYVAAGLLVAPVCTLGGVAARLTVGRRDQRLASLRLAGATSTQVTAMTLVEAAGLALVGAMSGAVLYAVAIVPMSRIPFQGRHFAFSELWVGVPELTAVVLAITALAVVSGVSGLRRVVVSPLGVTARQTPKGLSPARVAAVVVAGLVWGIVATSLDRVGLAVTLVVVAGMVATLNVIGPFVVMLCGRATARAARSPQTLLAARRIVDDPRSTWRSVGAIGLGITIAGLSSFFTSSPAPSEADPEGRLLLQDIGTGSLVTLGIITVIAATSTGVVQASRVIDQHSEYHALALAGTDLATLHSARIREVAIPLVATVVLASAASVGLLLPFASNLNPGVVVRVLVAAAGAVVLMLAAVTASRGLVRSAAAL